MTRRAFAALLLLLAVACTREQPRPPQSGGRLVRRLESDVKTLNYVLQTTDYERNVLAYVYDPLIDLDQNLKPIPGTAKSWDITDGGRTYTLHLDPRATFSDGTPVLAGDVVFTIHKIVEGSQQFGGFFEGVALDQTKALDDHTVRVVFHEPRVAQWYAFNVGVLPEHVYGKGKFATDYNDVAIGNGPYKIVRRRPGESILLERRNDYWREKPPIDSVLFRVIADDSVAWEAMQRGEIDEMRVRIDRWVSVKDRPEVKQKIDFRTIYVLSYNTVVWNESDPLFADPRVRRALAMCFDRQRVITNLYHGEARAITGPFTPDQWAYDPSVPAVPFDPAGAKALLAQAGWRDTNRDGILQRNGKPFDFDVLVPAGNIASAQQSQLLQQELGRVGVRMNIQSMEGAVFFDEVMKGKYQAAFFAWDMDPDPDPYPLFDSKQTPPNGMNIVHYSNPEVDRLLAEGRRESDQAKRTAIYHRLHAILAADQPYLWTVQVASKWAINRRVHNVKVSKGFGLYLWYPGPMGWTLQ